MFRQFYHLFNKPQRIQCDTIRSDKHSKEAGNKTNIKIFSLNIENKYIEQEIRKTVSFAIGSKLSRENQIKYIECLCESCITMVKEIERDKMKGIPM
jgi:hypothetical protein